MNNTLIFALIAAFSVLELMVLGGVLFFYLRLRRSEAMLNALQGNQEALLARIEQESGVAVPHLTEEALQCIAQHPLTGNVRELENLLHRAVALSDGHELHVEGAPTPTVEAPPPLPQPVPSAPAIAQPAEPHAPLRWSGISEGMPLPNDLQAWLDQQEREILVRALREAGFNRTATAARLGISLRQIRYRIARLHIEVPQDGDSHGDAQP